MNIEELIRDFIKTNVKKSLIEEREFYKYIYNEMSLEHEMGIYLKNKLGKKYMVQFERNIKDFEEIKDTQEFEKQIIDILIIDTENDKKYAIELKYHKKKYGEIPDTMYNCIKDMYFTQKLSKLKDFEKTVCVNIVDDRTFYINSGRKITRPCIYDFFRENELKDEYKKEACKQRTDITQKKPLKLEPEVQEYLPIKWKNIFEDNIKEIYLKLEEKIQKQLPVEWKNIFEDKVKEKLDQEIEQQLFVKSNSISEYEIKELSSKLEEEIQKQLPVKCENLFDDEIQEMLEPLFRIKDIRYYIITFSKSDRSN